jgi:hypothetical protein
MAENPKIAQAPCSQCVRKTKHEVLFETSQQDEQTLDTYAMMSCGGCSTISMGHQRRWIQSGEVEHKYYPSPVSRKMPEWMFLWRLGLGRGKGDAAIGAVMMEVYQTVDGGQYRLAAMGIRALLEQVMIQKVGDLKTFENFKSRATFRQFNATQCAPHLMWEMPQCIGGLYLPKKI